MIRRFVNIPVYAANVIEIIKFILEKRAILRTFASL